MTVILDQRWQDNCLPHHSQTDTQHQLEARKKPILRVSPDFLQKNVGSLTSPLPSPSQPLDNPALLSPATALSPTSPRSPTFKQKMHLRVRSLSGAKSPHTPRQKWERLSAADKDKSETFVKDAVSICGLAGYSWKKTHEYLGLAAELPLNPLYVVEPDVELMQTSNESSSRLSAFLEKKPSANSLLTPESASVTSASSRPNTSSSSLTSSSAAESSLKTTLKNIRLLFESMQKERHPVYLHYINMPDNNLKKMHAAAVAAHKAATLKKERSSLMDAIEFDRRAEKARNMELAVAKLRFEMELEAPEVVLPGAITGPKSTGSISSRPTANSGKSSEESGSVPPRTRRPFARPETSDMRRAASQNNRQSGVPTVLTTTSDMGHLRHLSNTSSFLERPDSPASALSEGVRVEAKDTWKKLQEAKARLSRKSKPLRVGGTGHPGSAQKIDSNGYFASRPTDGSTS